MTTGSSEMTVIFSQSVIVIPETQHCSHDSYEFMKVALVINPRDTPASRKMRRRRRSQLCKCEEEETDFAANSAHPGEFRCTPGSIKSEPS